MILLYSTNPPCPRCKVLHQKLAQAGIEFGVIEDTNKMEAMGFISAPMLEVDGKFLTFSEAIEWLNGR